MEFQNTFTDVIDNWSKKPDPELQKRILNQVSLEKKRSKDNTAQHREKMRDRLQLYSYPEKSKDKIQVLALRDTLRTLIALYYTDRPQVERSAQNSIYWEQSYNLTNAYKADYNATNMEVRDYLTQWNKFWHGVGIRMATWRDEESGCMKWVEVNPMYRYPDPDGHTCINNFEFMGFETNVDMQQAIHNESFYNRDLLESWLSSDAEETQTQQKSDQWIQQENPTGKKDKWKITLYYHQTYIVIDWEKKCIQTCTANDEKILLEAKEIEPLSYDGGKGNKVRKLKFPWALFYRDPIEWNPRGVSLPDVWEDKQKFQNLYYNLLRIKSTKLALWDKFFIDRSIRDVNKNLLTKKTVGEQYIPVDSTSNIQNMITKLPEDPLDQSTIQVPQILQNQLERSTVSDQAAGIDDGTPKTATEVRTDQINTNINLSLWAKINSRWEKDFAALWYCYTYYYFGDKDKKRVQINKWIGNTTDTISRKDIIAPYSPLLSIKSKGEIEWDNARTLAGIESIAAMLMNDVSIPAFSRRHVKRMLLLLRWVSKSQVDMIVPKTPEEMEAQEDVMFLNRNIPVKITDMEQDHFTYLAIYQTAMNTPATKAAIEARKAAYIQSGQSSQQNMLANTQSNNNVMNSVASAMANAWSQQTQQMNEWLAPVAWWMF